MILLEKTVGQMVLLAISSSGKKQEWGGEGQYGEL